MKSERILKWLAGFVYVLAGLVLVALRAMKATAAESNPR